MENRKKIINKLGGSRELAKELGLRPITVRTWIYDGVPAKHHDDIITLGRIQGIVISAEDLA